MRIFWKVLKVLGNIFGIFVSVFVSVALLAMLLVTPLLSGASAFTKPETIRQVVEGIDFGQIIRDGLSDAVKLGNEKELEFFLKLTESNAFGELVELYVTDLTGIFDREKNPSVITEDSLYDILERNMDELVQLVREIAEGLGEDTSDYTDEELEEEIRKFFGEHVDKFIELAPTVEGLRNLVARIVEGFNANPVLGDYVPGSNMEIIEDEYDNWQEFPSFEEGDGTGSVIMPGGDGIVSVIVPGDGGIIQNDNGESYYVTVDPETGAVKIVDANGNAIEEEKVIVNSNGGTASGGFVTFGHPVALHGGSIRVLSMGLSPEGSVPSGGDVAEEIIQYMSTFFTMVQNGTFTLLLVGIVIVLALLLCLLRWPRFKGFMWTAVVLLIGAAFLALSAAVITFAPAALSAAVSAMGFEAVNAIVAVVIPVISVFTNNMLIAAGIYAGVGILLIILFVIFRAILKKQKKRRAESHRKERIAEIADDAEANAYAAKAEMISEEPEEEPAEELSEEEEEEPAEELPEEEEEPAEEEEPGEEPAEEEEPGEEPVAE